MLKNFLLLGLLFIGNTTFATIFLPLPFDKQIEEATSAVEAKLESTRVFKNSSGMIMTEYTFDVVESYNLSDDDLDNQKLKLAMPGGSLDGITSMIDGAPQFRVDEKSFLLLKKVESNIYLSNFSLGKYKIQQFDGKTYYVSEVFPMDQNIGRISKEKMLELMKTKWKTSFSPVPSVYGEMVARVPSAPGENIKFEKREPAQESMGQEEVPVFFWSALALVSFFFALIFLKLSQSGQNNKSE